jgi:hypothetical protein
MKDRGGPGIDMDLARITYFYGWSIARQGTIIDIETTGLLKVDWATALGAVVSLFL